MKKTIMQSTIRVEGAYGVEIGDYAVITEFGDVLRKPFPEGWPVETDQTDGKIEVNEDLLSLAEMHNGIGASMDEYLKEFPDAEVVDMDGGGGLWNFEDSAEEPPPSEISVTATMKYKDTLGVEVYPGTYLLENGRITSRIPEDEIEPSEGEFMVSMRSYFDAKDTAEKLEAVADTEKRGKRGYID